MCEFCHTYPHLPGCPNAPEPVAIYTCEYCKDGIIEGDEFVEIDGAYYHVSCLSEEMNIYELLGLFGVSYQEATADDY